MSSRSLWRELSYKWEHSCGCRVCSLSPLQCPSLSSYSKNTKILFLKWTTATVHWIPKKTLKNTHKNISDQNKKRHCFFNFSLHWLFRVEKATCGRLIVHEHVLRRRRWSRDSSTAQPHIVKLLRGNAVSKNVSPHIHTQTTQALGHTDTMIEN